MTSPDPEHISSHADALEATITAYYAELRAALHDEIAGARAAQDALEQMRLPEDVVDEQGRRNRDAIVRFVGTLPRALAQNRPIVASNFIEARFITESILWVDDATLRNNCPEWTPHYVARSGLHTT